VIVKGRDTMKHSREGRSQESKVVNRVGKMTAIGGIQYATTIVLVRYYSCTCTHLPTTS